MSKNKKENIIVATLSCVSAIYIFIVINITYYASNPNTEINDSNENVFSCSNEIGFNFIGKIVSYLNIPCKQHTLNEIGDFLAGSLSIMAIIWFAIAFIWQARELSMQRAEFTRSVDALNTQITLTEDFNKLEREWRTRDQINDLKSTIIFLADRIYDRHDSHDGIFRPVTINNALSVLCHFSKSLNNPSDPSNPDYKKSNDDLLNAKQHALSLNAITMRFKDEYQNIDFSYLDNLQSFIQKTEELST